MTYSTLAVLAVAGVLVVDLVGYRTRMVTRPVFWVAYAIIVVFQLLMNGVLTGLGVVTYDPDAVWGPRIAYAPVEDLLFGFAMVTRAAFWAAYAIIVTFQLLMNGVLTGLDVVVYDPDTIWGPRIAYAPVEDLLFGFAMVTLTLASWAAVNRRANTARRRGLDTRTRRSSTR